MMELTSGVYLQVLPTKKYKTIRLNIRFATPLKKGVATKRTLLSSLLETNSEKYPTQTAVSKKLEELYGASFGFQVARKGNEHFLTAVLNIVNDKFLTEKNITKESLTFLKEMIFSPNIKEGAFEKETFKREQENLVSYLESIYEDKQSYAAAKLQELHFVDPLQQMPSYGSKEELLALTPEKLWQYYQQLLAEDEVVITIVGDLTKEEGKALLADFPFTPRAQNETAISYQQETFPEVKVKEEVQPTMQSKLHLGYEIPTSYQGKAYYTALIFNGLFGGFPHSKLFMNVREKESLAYYASSGLDIYRNFLSVQTGIEASNKDRVLYLIDEQLKSIQQGEITVLEIAQTKANLKNQYLMQLDAPQGMIENSNRQYLLKETMTKEDWLNNLEAVTKEEIVAYSQQVVLQSQFFLKGEM